VVAHWESCNGTFKICVAHSEYCMWWPIGKDVIPHFIYVEAHSKDVVDNWDSCDSSFEIFAGSF